MAHKPAFRWTRKHLLGLEDLSAEEIRYRPGHGRVLQGSLHPLASRRCRPCAAGWWSTLFFEDSTRTRTSFALAASRLSADVIDFSEKTSSHQQGRDADRHRPQHRGDGRGHHRRPPPGGRRGRDALAPRASARSSTPATAPTSTPRRACWTCTRSASASARSTG